MVSVQIVFETHSISTDNERGIATGWLPGELSERGRELARALGERRHGEPIACVFTSDLRRAVETAQLAFADTGIPIRPDTRLRECNYGDWNGMPVARLDAERVRHIDEPFPNGESYRQAIARVGDFLNELELGWDRQTVILIGHTATRWALDHLLDGIPLEEVASAPFHWRPGWRYRLGGHG
jgi:alpha-ribazole phosphatase/probable phosphoglycerate mutase